MFPGNRGNKIMADEEQSTPAEGTEQVTEPQSKEENVDSSAEGGQAETGPVEEAKTEEAANAVDTEEQAAPQTEPGVNTDGGEEEKVAEAGEPPPEGDSGVAETAEGAPAGEQPSEDKEEAEAGTTQAQEGEEAQEGASGEGATSAEEATGEENVEEGKEGEAKTEGQEDQLGEGATEGETQEGTTQEGETQAGEVQEGEPQTKVADSEEQPAESDALPTAEDGEPNVDGTEGAEEKPASPIPQSDTFQDGERPETPTVQVPEPLSREGSPTQEPTHLEAGTPEREESPRPEDIIEEEEEEEEEPFYSREELIEAYQTALVEKEQLQNHNTQLQHKLAEYFRKKKSDDQRQEMDKNVTDQEQRYLKYMSNLEDLRNQEAEERENFHLHLEELKEKKQDKLELVEAEDKNFTELKRTVASDAISSRTGKPLMPREVEMYITNELKKEEEVKAVRLENIKLKNRLKKREQQLKAKEELAEGLHLIDFEQLKIENQTYNEKIEERNEELLKLRKKITSTVQVLTHVKEKLQFVQGENQVQKSALKEVEALVAQKRDLLSRTKKARDSLRIDNQRLRQKSGLLGNKALLRDFEERKDEGDELRAKLERLKRMHAELVLKSAGVKKKIEESRVTRS